MTRSLVLASTAAWRGDLLRQLQVPFLQVDPELDETPWKQRGLGPRELVVELACAKAKALAPTYPDALLLGADQVAVCDGVILGKPNGTEGAVEQLLMLAGRSHELVTGLALYDPREDTLGTEVVVRTMAMRPLTPLLAQDYVRRDSPQECAGSYRFESLGIALFEDIDGDSSGVVGLPLMAVTRLLAAAGIDPLRHP
jgi:MAF protein